MTFSMPYQLFIGLRYLKAKRKQTFISIISLISVGGVALGVMALIIVLAVMSGFEGDLRDKIIGTNSHVVILKHGRAALEDYRQVVERVEQVEHVVAAAPFIYSQVMLTSEQNVSGVVLRGIDPRAESLVTNLGRNVIEGDLKHLSAPGEDGLEGIVLGLELARNLGAFYGDELNVVSPTGTMTPMGMVPRSRRMRVVAIFNSGMYEYDSSLVYVSLKTAQDFLRLGDRVTGVEVKVDDIYRAQDVARQIQRLLGFPFWTRDWMEMNRNLFSALKLEKLAMFIILTLIIVVAAFNIISTLIMMVMEKHKDIAILKSMGATSRGIMSIFVLEGLIIGLVGTLLGGVGGAITCWLADKYKLIKLAGDIYYMNYLPFKMRPGEVVLICLASILISFLATLYPSWQASKLDPAVALRYE
jgi:lipoprotein-releasing system permease protein